MRSTSPKSGSPSSTTSIRILRRELEGRVPLIGFAAAPFTLAVYLVEGAGSKNFGHIKGLLFGDPQHRPRADGPAGRRHRAPPAGADRGRRAGDAAVRHLGRTARARTSIGSSTCATPSQVLERLRDAGRAAHLLRVELEPPVRRDPRAAGPTYSAWTGVRRWTRRGKRLGQRLRVAGQPGPLRPARLSRDRRSRTRERSSNEPRTCPATCSTWATASCPTRRWRTC